tara:strand:- start:6539 stop:7147 length:609 start_codon:yes stop_codon:yes gene_type:complete
MSWEDILKRPQLYLTESKYEKFKTSQALDSLNRILRKDPAKTLNSDVGFRDKGIKGGRSRRPFIDLTTDKPLQSETIKELRDSGFYVTVNRDKDGTGTKYFIRGESFSGTENVEPTEEERRAITSPLPQSARDELARREANRTPERKPMPRKQIDSEEIKRQKRTIMVMENMLEEAKKRNPQRAEAISRNLEKEKEKLRNMR